MGWVRCLCSPACLCPLLALASPSQPQRTQALAHSALWGSSRMWSWLLAFFTNCVTVPVCGQNVTSPAHCLELSSITDQSLDPACRSGPISYGRGNLVMVQVGSLLGLRLGQFSLQVRGHRGHDEHPRSFSKASVTCSGPTLWRLGHLGCPTGRTCWAEWAQGEAAFWGLGSALHPPLLPP